MPEYVLRPELTHRPLDLLAVGSAVLELVVQIPHFPERGQQESIPLKQVAWSAGGCAVNVSCFAARVGTHAAPVICIGAGRHGREVLDELRQSRVDTSFVRIRHGNDGNMIFLITDEDGGWTGFDAIDPEVVLRPDDIPAPQVFQSAKIVHIDGFAFTTAGDERTIEAIVGRARSAGCLLSVDGAVPAVQTRLEFLRHLFAQADIVFANEYESLRVAGQDTLRDAIAAFQAAGSRWTVVKRGVAGSLLISRDTIIEVPAFDVHVVDTIAAGDAYVALTLAGLCRGLKIHEAALWGSAAGALACTRPGSLSAHFGIPELETLIRQQHGKRGKHGSET